MFAPVARPVPLCSCLQFPFMFDTIRFPSVFEATDASLTDVAEDLVTGLKIQIEGTDYIVGELALLEGAAPHRRINSAPSDLDYRLLLQTALAVAQEGIDTPLAVVTGFPYSSFSAYREEAKTLIRGEHAIQFDARTFGGTDNSVMKVDVREVGILPEIEGLVTALRDGERQEADAFFAVSLGYGTFESVLSLPSGTVQRTATSGHGLRLAARRVINRLQREHHLDMLTEHQADRAMREDFIITGRRRVNISGVRREVLQLYYDDVISPALEKVFSGRDFGRATKMYIAGGGAHYDTLIDAFNSEFGEILDVQVVSSPETCVSRGFALAAKNAVDEAETCPVGLDLGNANTAVAHFEARPTSDGEIDSGVEDASLFNGDLSALRRESSDEKSLFADENA